MLIAKIKDEVLVMLSLSDRGHLNPLKDLKNTPQRGRACRLTDLIGYCLSCFSEPFTKQKLRGALHTHHHQRSIVLTPQIKQPIPI